MLQSRLQNYRTRGRYWTSWRISETPSLSLDSDTSRSAGQTSSACSASPSPTSSFSFSSDCLEMWFRIQINDDDFYKHFVTFSWWRDSSRPFRDQRWRMTLINQLLHHLALKYPVTEIILNWRWCQKSAITSQSFIETLNFTNVFVVEILVSTLDKVRSFLIQAPARLFSALWSVVLSSPVKLSNYCVKLYRDLMALIDISSASTFLLHSQLA